MSGIIATFPAGGVSGVIADSLGDLFGSDYDTVFEIANSASGYGAPATLVTFSSDIGAGLIADAEGDLFGTILGGGADGDGAAFEIAKTASGYADTPTLVANFAGAGIEVNSRTTLIMDAAGDLFGATSVGGAYGDGGVFEIAKPGAGYANTPTLLASFDNGAADDRIALTMDANGDLFAATSEGGAFGEGEIVEIANTGTGYADTPTVLTNSGALGLAVDPAGNLFGTAGAGVFELAKTSTGYASTPTYLFAESLESGPGDEEINATSGPLMNAAGDLFFTTSVTTSYMGVSSTYGSLYEVYKTGATYADTGNIVATFDGQPTGLTADAAGNIFVTVSTLQLPSYTTDDSVYEVSGIGFNDPTLVIDSTSDYISTEDPTQTIAGTIDSADAGLAVSIYDGATLLGTTKPGADGDWSLSVTLFSTLDVSQIITATATDAAGNTGTSNSITYTLFAPALAITSESGLTNQTDQTISGTIDAADADLTVSLYDGSTLIGTATPAADGDWSAAVALPSIQGPQEIYAQAINAAGLSGTASAVSFYDTDGQPDVVTASEEDVFLVDAQVSVFGGFHEISFVGASGDAVSLYDTVGVWRNIVDGSGGTVSLDSAQATVSGGGDRIYFGGGSGNASNLSDTNGDWDTVAGSNGEVTLDGAQTSVIGGNDGVIFEGGSGDAASFSGTDDNWDTVEGSSAAFLFNDAQASIFGGGDTIRFAGAAGNAASLYDTDQVSDTVDGSNGVIYINGAQASVVGGGDTIYFEGASGNLAELHKTFNHWDAVNGSNAAVDLDGAQASIFGGNDTITATAGSIMSLYGDKNIDQVTANNAYALLTVAQAEITGGGDNISAGAGSRATLTGTNGKKDAFTGTSDVLTLDDAQAWITGGRDTIYLEGASGNVVELYQTDRRWDAVDGSNGAVYLHGAQALIANGGDAIYLAGSSELAFESMFGLDTVNGFAPGKDTIQFSAADFANFTVLSQHMTQSGLDTVITLDAADSITLTNVLSANLTAAQFHFV